MSGHQHTMCGKPETIVGILMGGRGVSVMLVFAVCSSETGTYHGSSVLYWKGCKIPEWHTEVGFLHHAHIKLGCFSTGLDKCHNEYLFIVGSEAKVIMREHLLLSKLNETESLPIKLNTETHSTFYLPKHLSELPQKLQKERFKSNSHFAMKAASWRVCLLWKTWNEMLVKNYVEAKAAMHSECQQRQCESWSLCQGRLAMGLIPLVLGPSSGKGGEENGDAQCSTPWSIQRQQQRATAAAAATDSDSGVAGKFEMELKSGGLWKTLDKREQRHHFYCAMNFLLPHS